jgi:hypothetical protein
MAGADIPPKHRRSEAEVTEVTPEEHHRRKSGQEQDYQGPDNILESEELSPYEAGNASAVRFRNILTWMVCPRERCMQALL